MTSPLSRTRTFLPFVLLGLLIAFFTLLFWDSAKEGEGVGMEVLLLIVSVALAITVSVKVFIKDRPHAFAATLTMILVWLLAVTAMITTPWQKEVTLYTSLGEDGEAMFTHHVDIWDPAFWMSEAEARVSVACTLSAGTYANGSCACVLEVDQTQEEMYDEATGFCQSSIGGPAGEAFELFPPRCSYQGHLLAPGESYDDGCNTHTCQANGDVLSTERGCEPNEEIEDDVSTYTDSRYGFEITLPTTLSVRSAQVDGDGVYRVSFARHGSEKERMRAGAFIEVRDSWNAQRDAEAINAMGGANYVTDQNILTIGGRVATAVYHTTDFGIPSRRIILQEDERAYIFVSDLGKEEMLPVAESFRIPE